MTNVATGALVACILVSIIVTPVVDRLHLPFAALAFSAVVSMIPGFFLFEAASALVKLVSMGPGAPVTLLTNIAANSATAFLVILAMTFGLILPRMLVEDRSCRARVVQEPHERHPSSTRKRRKSQASVRNSGKA